MSYFKKFISYFEYYEYGCRVKNGGHVKVLVHNDKVIMDLHLRGLPCTESRLCEIRSLGSRSASLGRFPLDRGTGYYNACYYAGDMDGAGLSVFDITGLQIALDDERYCQTTWHWEQIGKNTEEREQRRKEESTLTAQELKVKEIKEPARRNVAEVKVPEVVQREDAAWATLQVDQREVPETETQRSDLPKADETVTERPHETAEIHMPVSRNVQKIQEPSTPISEDKWQQLCALYPVCHPFGSKEDYVSITPGDFVVLRKEYQNLVSNSFLLHGFYNYHHIILGRKEDPMGEIYYLGVPGAYYEREKMVAVMFGFEGFQVSDQKRNSGVTGLTHTESMAAKKEDTARRTPAGAFGYYMRRVEI
ncbi:MAG: hypothetical protein PUH86_04855 [Lachnospiraceae bacterium]|nr:hypothetical protein [Lachnospiraceae bacterium]